VISSLEGRLAGKIPGQVVIEVGGVGFLVDIPLSTYYALPPEGERVRIHALLHVQEDALRLFGFATVAEKAMFIKLTQVSRIGPKLAVGILSGIGVAELRRAILAGDVAALSRIPGVGAKSAGRLVVELKDKVVVLEGAGEAEAEAGPGVDGVSGIFEEKAGKDALSALMNLGYRKADAEKALREAAGDRKDLRVEELLKETLRRLSRG